MDAYALKVPSFRRGFRRGFSTLRPTPYAPTICPALEIPISRYPPSFLPSLQEGAGGRLVFILCVEWGIISYTYCACSSITTLINLLSPTICAFG